MQIKAEKEQEMRNEWLINRNDTEEEEPEFYYYDFENWLLRNYYIYMTVWSQGELQLSSILLKNFYYYFFIIFVD